MNRLPGAFRGVLMMMAVAFGWLGMVRIWPEKGFIGSSNFHVLSYPSWNVWMEVPEEVVTVAEVEERIEQWTGTGTVGELRSLEQSTGTGTGSGTGTGTGTGGELRSLEQSTGTGTGSGTGTGTGTRGELTGDSTAWARFHAFVERAQDSSEVVHVFHFGDSQIEGDRFTEVLRKNFQLEFGGIGPGWLTVDAPSPTMTVNLVSEKGTCLRNTRYMVADSTLQDERFGWLACRTSCDSAAAIAFEVHRRSSPSAAVWDKTQIVLDTASSPCPIQWKFTDGLAVTDTLQAADSTLRRIELVHAGRKLEQVVFPEGVERILGVGMWGKDSTGVVVHNVPMRGSSGTLFRKLDREVLREQAAGLAVGCVLLQYGGNAVPYLKDSLAAERYGRWFGSNLRLIQEMFPEAAVVVMGNADMAENVNGSWVTRPLVENVRDALKASALAEHALFFDVYEAMGGRNSMGAWVAAEPALAAADHVHFTRRGSRLLAERLWALLFEQEAS